MKNIINRWLLLFLLLLGMSALACNLPFGGEAEPTPRPTRDDTDDDDEESDAAVDEAEVAVEEVETAVADTAEEVVEEVETAVAEAIETTDEDSELLGGIFQESITVRDAVQQFDTLESYQMQFHYSATVDDRSQTVQATILVSTKPSASQVTFSFSGFEGMAEATTMEMTQLDGISYVNMAEFGCISSGEDNLMEDSFDTALDANEFLSNVGEAELVGEETINGIETLHYTFDETAVDDETTQFTWAQGDVYIAKDGNYVVRFHLEGEGTVESLGLLTEDADDDSKETETGLIQVDMNVTNINEPLTITIPAACENSGIENADFPVLDDAFEATSFGGIVTYKTESAFGDIVAFYEAALVTEGWIYQEETSFILDGTTALLFFAKDGRSLTVTVTEDTQSDAFLVVIFEE